MSCDQIDEFFQRTPVFNKPTRFAPKSWTESTTSYCAEAKRLTACILRNRRSSGRPIVWFVTIYVWPILHPSEIASLWKKSCRKLKQRGMTAIWVREPTRSNKVHYHILVVAPIDEAELVAAVEAAMPPRKQIGWHKKILAVSNEWWLTNYVTKNKIAGRKKGKLLADKHAPKRLLFKTNTKLKKFGAIGDFWVRPKKVLWREICEIERRISDGLLDRRVRCLAAHAHRFIQGYIPLKKIERSFGFDSNGRAVRQWIERLDAAGDLDISNSICDNCHT